MLKLNLASFAKRLQPKVVVCSHSAMHYNGGSRSGTVGDEVMCAWTGASRKQAFVLKNNELLVHSESDTLRKTLHKR